MRQTENLKLNLIDSDDLVNINDLNANFENIDILINQMNNNKNGLSMIIGVASNVSFSVSKSAGSGSKTFKLTADKPIKCIFFKCNGYITISGINGNKASYKIDGSFVAGSDISASGYGSETSYSCGINIPAPNDGKNITITVTGTVQSGFASSSLTVHMDNFKYIMFTE